MSANKPETPRPEAPAADSANATTGAGLKALIPEAEVQKAKLDKSEAKASAFAEAAAAVVTPSPGAGRYDGGEEP